MDMHLLRTPPHYMRGGGSRRLQTFRLYTYIHKRLHRRHHSTFGQKYKYSLDKFNKTLFVQWDYMSLENNILRALSLYRMSAFKDFFKVVLGSHSAYGRTLCRNSGGLHLRPVCFDTGKAIRAPSMHADLFTASMRGTASRNCCTKLK